uniref:AH domain-containing protein n=1 Tax=Rhabditophanes sp. KR3021 TaxID=114890 RepID=A0AC35TPV0_9BILA
MIRTQLKVVYPIEISGSRLRMLQADIDAMDAKDIFSSVKSETANDGFGKSAVSTTTNTQTSSNNNPGIGPLNIQRADLDKVQEKFKVLKKWTVSTFKNTKQNVLEHMGKVERTIDVETEGKIEYLKELSIRYKTLLKCAKTFADTFKEFNKAKKDLSEAFYQLGIKETLMTNHCNEAHEVIKDTSQNGDFFEKAVTTFVDAMETLCDKTMQDTFFTIQMYEIARLEYDVVRGESAALKDNNGSSVHAITEAEEKVRESQAKYEGMIRDVHVKMTLLQENRLKVMKQHMDHFEKAFGAYSKSNSLSFVNKVTTTHQEKSFLER